MTKIWKMKLYLISLFLLVLMCTVFVPGVSQAEKSYPFKFNPSELTPKGSITKVQDPMNPSAPKVQKFYIDGTRIEAADRPYNSVRAVMREDIYSNRPKGKNGQPKEAWYGWDIYFPKDFPSGPQQTKGGVRFFNFKHTNECSSMQLVHQPGYGDHDLFWRMSRVDANIDCPTVREVKVADIRKLKGKWTRFEIFVRWSREGDGIAEVYVDGTRKVHFEGVTCIEDCYKFNPFAYGIYKSNSPSLASIKPSYVLFKNVSRGKTRQDLAFKQ